MNEHEVELKLTLDELIESKKYNAAIRVLRTVKDTFSQYDLYVQQVKELMAAKKLHPQTILEHKLPE